MSMEASITVSIGYYTCELYSNVFLLDKKVAYTNAVADPRGVVWGNCPPKRLWCPAGCAPLEYAPFWCLTAMEVETEIKKYSEN